MYFKKLNLKGRMLLGYTVPIILYLIIAGLVYTTANKVFDAFQEVERVQNVLNATKTMELGGQGMIRSIRGYLLNPTEEYLSQYEENLRSARESHQKVQEIVRYQEQKDRLQQLNLLVEEYNQYSQQLIAFIKAKRNQQAIDLFKTGKGTEFVLSFDRLMKEFNEVQIELLNQKTTYAKNSLNFLISALIAGSILLITGSVLIALAISSGITNTINRVVNMIASSSTEIAATVTQQERTSAQQASSVHQTTSTMDELSASSRHAAEQAEFSAESARQILKLAESSTSGANQVLNLAEGGMISVAKTVEGISTLKEKVEAIAEHILHLSQQMNQISSITSLVTDLANQTNMLALNAAVEAVRAGEHGKGFGVVASEIRKLSDQSKKSAEKINLLINEIQNAIHVTVMVTDEGLKKAEEGIERSEGTAEAFTNVTQSINEIILRNQETALEAINRMVESCQQISLTSKQQAIAIGQVVDAMNAINQGASETASGMSQTKESSQKLNEAALNLQSVI